MQLRRDSLCPTSTAIGARVQKDTCYIPHTSTSYVTFKMVMDFLYSFEKMTVFSTFTGVPNLHVIYALLNR